jgi:site-specific recombinase XerD
MLDELQLRNLSANTVERYISIVQQFASHFGKSPEKLGAEHVREYLLYLMREKKAAANTVLLCRAALRFLYLCTLKQTWFDASIPHPKRRATLPGILSADEITRMLDRTINLKHWAILATFYATALRCRELQHLKVQDIDSERMLIHIREAKGGVPRQIPLSPVLLERLRIYVRRYRPQDWLFPSPRKDSGPLEKHSIRHVCQLAGERCDIKRPVHPHLFRHASATHMLDAGVDLRTIQAILGHADLRTTARYLHVSTRRLQSFQSPFDSLALKPLDSIGEPEPEA